MPNTLRGLAELDGTGAFGASGNYTKDQPAGTGLSASITPTLTTAQQNSQNYTTPLQKFGIWLYTSPFWWGQQFNNGANPNKGSTDGAQGFDFPPVANIFDRGIMR